MNRPNKPFLLTYARFLVPLSIINKATSSFFLQSGGLTMHPMLNIAVRAARSAGSVISRGFENFDDLQIEQKGENDFVTKIDKEAEQAIINKIQSCIWR